MTLEEAVERVERELAIQESLQLGLDELQGFAASPSDAEPNFFSDLCLILAEAKRPRVYALGEEEREALGDMLADLQRTVEEYHTTQPRTDRQQRMAALTAALALEQPEEPFTVEELRWFAAWGAACVNDGLNEEKELLAKLRAYIEKKEKE